MFIFQVLVIFSFLLFFSSLIIVLFKKFNNDLKIALLFLTPLLVFSFGFILRLSARPPMVDLGYFLTEFSGLFISILFAVCLLLGQLRYWKK
jgi:hypothetical protein